MDTTTLVLKEEVPGFTLTVHGTDTDVKVTIVYGDHQELLDDRYLLEKVE